MRPIDADAIPWCDYDLESYHSFTGVDKEYVDDMPTLTPEDLGIVRCNDCAWFDDEGYENYDPEMPELRMGFCKTWRRDTQACRFCSMGGGK